MKTSALLSGRWARAAVAVATVAVSALTATGTAAAQSPAHARVRPNIGWDGVYDHIVNNNSGLCLALPGASTAYGAGVIQWPCGSWTDHYWTTDYQFTESGYYWYHVVNRNSGQCLALPGASTQAGAQLVQWPCGQWKDHYWAFELDTNGQVHIVNYNSRQCLALPGASTQPGAPVIQWPCGTWADHYWH
ncbi:RICIN domain-containing protein [Kitasatospora sp. NPDC002227]|uniref:RICIN domain-containing protein n=1 Tax=Kitasatospora sp. NPDC002227 TaxID=3154773 RepID=UPI003328849A